ncbi:unnamed protein product, partial [marine sediment metagenome]
MAKKFRVPVEQLKVVEIPGGFGIVDVQVEISPPEPPGEAVEAPEGVVVPEAPAPPVEPEAPVEEPGIPADVEDKFIDDLEKKGAARLPDGTTYKLTTLGPQDAPAVERTIAGDREILVGIRGEKFTSLEQARLWAIQDAKDRLRAPEAPAAAPTFYRSGASRINDLKGTLDAGVPAGVVITQLSKPAEKELIARVQAGARVMIDNGAFEKFPDDEITVKEATKIVERYNNILGQVPEQAGNVAVVAPDVIGNQDATIKLIDAVAEDLRDVIDNGGELLVPYQMGDRNLEEYVRSLSGLLGTRKWTLSLP